jgi:hypothetical protein
MGDAVGEREELKREGPMRLRGDGIHGKRAAA